MVGDGKAILLGDFNAGEDQPPIQYLVQNDVLSLNDVYRNIHNEPSESDMTFYGWEAHTPGTGKRLDYIFYTGPLHTVRSEVVQYNIDGRYPSDHMPVLAEFGY